MSKIKTRKPSDESITGTYRYDRATGQVVRVSDKTPKVASKGGSMPCGQSPSSCDNGGGCGGDGCAD